MLRLLLEQFGLDKVYDDIPWPIRFVIYTALMLCVVIFFVFSKIIIKLSYKIISLLCKLLFRFFSAAFCLAAELIMKIVFPVMVFVLNSVFHITVWTAKFVKKNIKRFRSKHGILIHRTVKEGRSI
jgi:hypothetical protein